MNNLKLPQEINNVIVKLQKAGFSAYLVGGSVRNLLMDRKTTNWDFTTNATPEDVLKVFPKGFYDNRFGTVGVPHEDGLIYEITTFRSEEGYSDKRHPDKVVWGKNLDQDLSRRDFTINAIAFDGKKLIDPYKGQDDIVRRVVKTVGDPFKRFNEDALRLIRAVRIASQLQFSIDEKTLNAITKYAELINSVSKERLRDEMFKILASSYPKEGIMLLKNSGLLKAVLPELEACFGVEQKSPERHHIYDVGTHLIMSLKYCKSKDSIVRFATLLHDIGKPATYKIENGIITFYNHEVVGTQMAKKISERLKFSKKDRDKFLTLIRWHQFTVDEKQTDKAVRRFIRRVGKENIDDMLDLRVGDRLGGGARETSWRLEEFKKRLVEVQKQPFTVADLKIDGYDVMKLLKIKPGPKIGEILNKLFEEVEEDLKKNNRDYLLNRIKDFSSV